MWSLFNQLYQCVVKCCQDTSTNSNQYECKSFQTWYVSVISVYQHLPIAYQFFNKGMVHFYPLYGWGTIWCTEMFKGIFFSKIFPQEHADCHRRAQYCKEWNLRGRGAIFGRWIFPGVRNVKKPKDGGWTWWYVTRILYKIYVNMNAICLMLCEDDIYTYRILLSSSKLTPRTRFVTVVLGAFFSCRYCTVIGSGARRRFHQPQEWHRWHPRIL